MAAWPGTLPQWVLSDGYEETLQNGLLRTNMDSGPPKSRRRFTAGIKMIKAAIEVTDAEVAIFESFFTDDCFQGALPFTWVHPRTQQPVSFRFTEQPRVVNVGGTTYRCAMSLEILP